MSEFLTIKAVVIPFDIAGQVLLAGAAEFVTDAILELDLDIDYFQREADQSGAGVTCVRVELGSELPEQLSRRIETALANLIDATPELAGWTASVSLVEPPDDGDKEDADAEDLDLEHERMLPSADELASRLIHDIDHERSIYAAAELFQAMPTEELATGQLDCLSPAERTVALRRESALAGCLVDAAVITVDHLIVDIVSLRTGEAVAPDGIEDTWVLSQLPARFAPKYTALFAQQFLVALIDVTSRLTQGWQPLASVAQELGLRVLLNQVEVVADAADVALDDDWRGHLEDLLFEDVDHELLYDPAYDGIEDDPESQPPGMAPMRFEDWFRPFNDERTMPPYALPLRSSADLDR